MKAKKYTKETICELGLNKQAVTTFSVGDTIAVSQRIKEGDKERLQVFEGDVIAIHNNGACGTFTIRKIASNSIAVERIFPFHSPKIESIRFIRHGDTRRAKLYYMRDRIGKSARVKEKVMSKKDIAHEAEVRRDSESEAK